MPGQEPPVDEFGIPIKTKKVPTQPTVDEFGIPVKKKETANWWEKDYLVGGGGSLLGGMAGNGLSQSNGKVSEKQKVLDYVYGLKTPEEKKFAQPYAITQVNFKKNEKPFEPTEKDYTKAYDKINEVMLGDNEDWKDPIKSLQNKYDGDIAGSTAAISLTQSSLMPSGYKALKVLSDSHFANEGEDNLTANMLKDRVGRYNKVAQPFRELGNINYDDERDFGTRWKIYDSAIRAYANKNPHFAAQAQAAGIDLSGNDLLLKLGSDKKSGQIMADILNDPDLLDYVQNENPNLLPSIRKISDDLIYDNKEYGKVQLANEISSEMERSGYNKIDPIFNFKKEAKESGDATAKALYVSDPKKLQFYEENKDEILNMLDAPSLLEGFAGGAKRTLGGIKNTFTVPFESIPTQIKDNWEKEASHVSADPKGLVNFLRNTGDVLGLVATIGATGNVLGGGGAGVYSRSVVPAISGSVPFFGDMLETATSKYPNSPVKAWVSAITNTAMYAALSQSIFPASKAAQAIKQVEPSVSKVIENLTSGSIKREVARRELQTLTKKAIDFAGGSVLKSAKIAGELTAIGMVDKALDKIMGLDKTAFEQYHPQGQEADTFGSMFLSNLVLGGMVKFGEMKRGNRIVEESLYSAANNPKRFERVIESIDDPSLNKEQMLSNLKFVSDTKAILDGRGVDERNQKRYLFNALKNRVASEERTKLPDENLVRKHDEENKRFGVENDKILNGEDIVGDDIFENNIKTPEGKLLKKSIDSGDMKDRLSAETALKTEGGVDMLLKEIADQALNKIAPDESTKEQSLQRAKEAYGEELTNLAIKKFPEIESSQEPIKEETGTASTVSGGRGDVEGDIDKLFPRNRQSSPDFRSHQGDRYEITMKPVDINDRSKGYVVNVARSLKDGRYLHSEELSSEFKTRQEAEEYALQFIQKDPSLSPNIPKEGGGLRRGDEKTFADFISQNRLNEISDKFKDKSFAELKALLADQKSKFDRKVRMGQKDQQLKQVVWDLKELVSAHEKANEHNSRLSQKDTKSATEDMPKDDGFDYIRNKFSQGGVGGKRLSDKESNILNKEVDKLIERAEKENGVKRNELKQATWKTNDGYTVTEFFENGRGGTRIITPKGEEINLFDNKYKGESGQDISYFSEAHKDQSLSSNTPSKEQASPVSGVEGGDVVKQIENFGVPKEDVDATHDLLNQVFSGLKKAGLTASKTVGDWVGIGKGSEKPYSLKIGDKEVQVKNTQPEVVNGFYSPLEKVITESKFDKLPAKQWAEKYANSEEAKWTGLKDWLAQQQGSVSKADIQQFLKDNRIQVVEVVKGEDMPNYKLEIEPPTELGADRMDLLGDLGKAGNLDNPRFRDYLNKKYGKNGNKIYDWLVENATVEGTYSKDTKFSQYQLEGQKYNYKEILVTMPAKKTEVEKKINDFFTRMSKKYGENFVSKLTPEENRERVSLSMGLDVQPKNIPFKSSHFDEPNILVHLRMNTRVDAEGKKVLFLEEVQSDFGQSYKKDMDRIADYVNKNEESIIELYKKSGKLKVVCP